MSYGNYTDRELERMIEDNNRRLRDPYEQNKWVEREQNRELEEELERRRNR